MDESPGLENSDERWWGYSQQDGWVVVDFNDSRNRPGAQVRTLVLTRCHDLREVEIEFNSWVPPNFTSAQDYLNRITQEKDQAEEAKTLLTYQRQFPDFKKMALEKREQEARERQRQAQERQDKAKQIRVATRRVLTGKFVARCQSCQGAFEVQPVTEVPGFLQCPGCRNILSEVDVSPWDHWIAEVVKIKKVLQERRHFSVDPDKISRDGTGAELAACLCLCPGFLDVCLRQAQTIAGPNVGRDLLGGWAGYSKDFEIKHTVYCTPRCGVLFIRRPANLPDLEPLRDVQDCIYVLFNGNYPRFFGTCWADRPLFLQNGVMDPPQLPPGKPTFGNHYSRFNRFPTIVSGLGLKPASVHIVSCSPCKSTT